MGILEGFVMIKFCQEILKYNREVEEIITQWLMELGAWNARQWGQKLSAKMKR